VYRRQGGEGGTLYLREEIKEKERRSRAGSSAKSRETPCRPLWSTRPELCRHHRHPSVEKGARTAGVGGSMPTIRAEGTGKIKCAIHQLPKITGETIPLDWASRRSHRLYRWGHGIGRGMAIRGREHRRRSKT
jgi:hypothetical protein